MSEPISISGFTIVRNAQILDYPFKESVRSVISICDEFIINCGKSDDDTLILCKELQTEFPGKVKIIETEWMQEKQAGGYQLKAQTDRAIQECKGNWCFYIQADEAVHENDLKNIQEAIGKSHHNVDVDGILFNYIHFYGDYNWAIQGRNWYRREVRCFKQGLGIEAFRDAQGFRRKGSRLNVIHSGANVYHYGYVRNSKGLEIKSTEMGKWWESSSVGQKNDFRLIKHVGLYKFLGSHPRTMLERIEKSNFHFDPSEAPRKWDRREIKNAITLLWESLTGYRIGEFRNYELLT